MVKFDAARLLIFAHVVNFIPHPIPPPTPLPPPYQTNSDYDLRCRTKACQTLKGGGIHVPVLSESVNSAWFEIAAATCLSSHV